MQVRGELIKFEYPHCVSFWSGLGLPPKKSMKSSILKKIKKVNQDFKKSYPSAPKVQLYSIVLDTIHRFFLLKLNVLIKITVFLSCVLCCFILYSMNNIRLEADLYDAIPQPVVFEETLLQVDPTDTGSWAHSIIKWTAYGIWGYAFVHIAPATIVIGGCTQLIIMYIPEIITTTVVPTNFITTVVPTVTTIIPVVVPVPCYDWSSIFAHHLLNFAQWRSALGPIMWNEWGLWTSAYSYSVFQGFADTFEILNDCYIICRCWSPSLFLDINIIIALIRLNDLLIEFWPATVTRGYFSVVDDRVMWGYAMALSDAVNALAHQLTPIYHLEDIRDWVWFL